MLCPLNRCSTDPAIIDGADTYTYQECHQLCCGIVQDLQKRGIRKGAVVALRADTALPVILTLFALWRLGAICCPLSTRLPSIHAQLKQISATHFVIPKLNGKSQGTCELDLQNTATYLFTSGSTGRPKVAIHTLSNHLYSALGINSYLKFGPTDTWKLSLPLWHVGGLAILFRTFLAGGAVVLNGPATHASWVPTQLGRALDHPTNYKSILIGGAPLPPELALKAAHLPLIPTYGLTEMSSTVLARSLPLPYRRVKLQNGELFVAGEVLFKGYLGENPQNGWFATGDLAAPDFTILGRKDRLFISGGENIQPEEIETALLKIPGIQNACVVPVPDLEFGQRPVAFIDNLHASKELLSDLLPRFKHPIRYFVLPNYQGKPDLPALALKAKTLMQS
ncbi:MAG: AMP-binding protein [Chlamydiia bacterium]|nr:AMP-binding protein [Chlamydiia bacterium]